MSVIHFIDEFRALHARARKGELTEADRPAYMAAREQFARALTAAQGMTLKPGEMARQTFRVAQAMQIELSLNTGIIRAMTLDISKGGFFNGNVVKIKDVETPSSQVYVLEEKVAVGARPRVADARPATDARATDGRGPRVPYAVEEER